MGYKDLRGWMEGDQVDLFKFPAPRYHEQDGGRYIGTASVTITKDPDSDWVNLGAYRVMVHDKNTLGFYISPGKQGRIHREKYFAAGQPCPVAISFGQDPLLFLIAGLAMPAGVCEYNIAGGVKGEPFEVVSGKVTGLCCSQHQAAVPRPRPPGGPLGLPGFGWRIHGPLRGGGGR